MEEDNDPPKLTELNQTQASLHNPFIGHQYDPRWFAHQQAMMQMQMQMQMHMSFHPQHGYPVHQGALHGGGMDLGLGSLQSTLLGGVSSSPEAYLGPFPCVKVSNLPFDVTIEDVLILFQGFVIIDVFLSRSNEAFVVFANPMDFQMAMQRDRQTMGGRIIEITPSQRSEYYGAISEKTTEKAKEISVVESRSILGVEDNSNDGGFPDPSGVLSWALGQPPPTQTLNNQSASESSRGKGIGSQSGRGAGRGGPAVRRTGGGIQVGEHTGFIRMRGLPFSSTKEDIINFFVSEGLKVIPDSIVLTFRGDGRATGEGYVGFESPEDSKAAMGLHRNTMGSRYIELFISNKEEHSRAFSRFGNK